MTNYDYLKALLRYKKWERSLKGLPKEEREKVMRAYQIKKPSKYSSDITIRALESDCL